MYSFAKGLLQLDLPIPSSSAVTADASVVVWKTTVLGGGMQQRVVLPVWAVARWPPELAAAGFEIEVVGLNVGGVAYTLSCDTWCDEGVGEEAAGEAAPRESKPMHDLCCTLKAD